MIHEDRDRAGSFGADAARYDRARPRYPDAMVDDLLRDVAATAPRVLDVGCGTGIAGEAFLARGCDVLGVEPDERMAAVARAKGLQVDVATFEDWPDRGRTFDLVVSGQAWHWVDPGTGPRKAARLLNPGGRLAVFWNLGRHDDATQAAFDDAYATHAPHLLKESVALGRVRLDPGTVDAEAFRAAGCFAEPRVTHYEWAETHTTAEWVDLLRTYSDHALLPPEVRAALLAGVARAIDGLGGRITTTYDTVCVTAAGAQGSA